MSSLFRAFETALARGLLALPAPLLRALAGPPVVREGRTLDAQAQLIIRASRLTRAKPASLRGVAAVREELNVSGGQLAPHVPDSAFTAIHNATIATRPVRIYRPLTMPANKRAPTTIFFHGGGHTAGSLDSHDAACRALSVGARCTVIAVDYRLAPEHAYPRAADDVNTRIARALHTRAP